MGNDFADGYLTYPTNGRQCDNCTVSTNSTATTTEAKKTTTIETKRKKRELSLMTRKTFYAMLRDKLERCVYIKDKYISV